MAMTERDMLDLLLDRYTDVRQGTISDRWIRAEYVPSTLHWRQRKRVADFVAADRYPADGFGTGFALHGHEVKVSRSDWLAELADPTKAEAVRQYMHYWWLVVPDAAMVKLDELPEQWGLMAPSKKGGLRVRRRAPRLEPTPMPLDFSLALMGAVARTAYRDPLRRDAPLAYVDAWGNCCGFCGEQAPCSIHQPRQREAFHEFLAREDRFGDAQPDGPRLQDERVAGRDLLDVRPGSGQPQADIQDAG